ncbi:hypothetical protein [Actinokineospora sp. HUAS TT18]|uniref:hypothetical protein n=1 Tax=Actinokineospora sp. HUAS TT18 TaxID=3447451 RepID=UPI003F51E970
MTATIRTFRPGTTQAAGATRGMRRHDEPVRLAGRRLAPTLAAEDRAEHERGLSPHERITCRLHRRWAHECIASPQHVIPVTGHRWCDDCATAVTVAVDELDGRVALACPRCHRTPSTRATEQIVRTCQASLGAAGRLARRPAATQPHERFARSRTA